MLKLTIRYARYILNYPYAQTPLEQSGGIIVSGRIFARLVPFV